LEERKPRALSAGRKVSIRADFASRVSLRKTRSF